MDGFRLLPGVRNVPPDLLEAMVTPPAEPNPRTSAKWSSRPPKALKYVDDRLSLDCLNFENSVLLHLNTRLKHAVQSQHLFRHIVSRAEAKGMVVNLDNTQLLLVSDSVGHRDEAYIEDLGGNELTSGEDMKVLGFHFPWNQPWPSTSKPCADVSARSTGS